MPPMRFPVNRLAQGVRTFSSVSPGALRTAVHHPALHFHHQHILPHSASQRILSKASKTAQTAQTHWATVPEAIRDVTSYLALGALTSEAAFLVYCWDQNADLTDFLAV
ncbi:hypothetical protein Z517_02696 [Fonsecaea pedrosoi CBS 271.37]|uniref:Unplaced genomic scaffold supercont1.2, whole genome shotgun sequence n=1 Tax=Fonsecaea pedrosoi CBS 271.37 TaxID=1442368 RepID=A0A0D2E0B0_9EURO|nr:uncharacterized protein Z517_02696 [Fonsecaea pedrosoi CBS 271.37]KIW83451.1 hypothetical protein Z517_02696 [Fonsecaea pedrosoi CBS 271.37]